MKSLHGPGVLALLIPMTVCNADVIIGESETPVRFQIETDPKPLGGNYEPFYISEESRREFFGYWRKPAGIWILYFWDSTNPTHKFNLPAPRVGEIFPMFGRLYQATGGPDPRNLTFVQLTAEEMPEGCEVQRTGTWLVPLQRGQIGYLVESFRHIKGNVRFSITSIDPDPSSNGDWVATGEALVKTVKGVLASRESIQLALREGERYSLGGHPLHKFTVRRIVPRDEKLKTMGWVELELAWRKDDR